MNKSETSFLSIIKINSFIYIVKNHLDLDLENFMKKNSVNGDILNTSTTTHENADFAAFQKSLNNMTTSTALTTNHVW